MGKSLLRQYMGKDINLAHSKQNEKTLLRIFLGTYLISSFVMLSVIMWQSYSSALQSLRENEHLKMQEFTANIAIEIIKSDSKGKKPNLEAFKAYHYTLYDKNKKPLMGRDNKMVNWNQTYYMSGGASIFVSKAAQGSHGVEYIVVDDLQFEDEKNKTKQRLIFIYIAALVGIAFVAWVLSRIFLTPIRQKVDDLDRFVKDSTHELNTPITALMLSVDSLEQNPSNPKVLERIKLSAKRLSNLYGDLTFSQLSQPGKEKIQKIDLKSVAQEALLFFEPFAKQKKITLEREVETLIFEIDPDAAFRLFSNLISNAIKYTNQGGTIKVTLKDKKFKVSDTGIGIEKDKIEAIFQRYQRFDSVRGGFGIGLDIVANTARYYDILIEVESEEGKGSKFSLLF